MSLNIETKTYGAELLMRSYDLPSKLYFMEGEDKM
jgi:hypothetical protein